MGGKASNRMALGLVSSQKFLSGLPTNNGGQFPGQILSALNGSIEAEPFVARHSMGCISDKEYPPHLELRRHVLGRLPVSDIQNLNWHAWLSDGLLDQLLTA